MNASSNTVALARDQNPRQQHELEFPLNWHGDKDDSPLKEWLIDKTLPKVGTAFLSGQWGLYKTFVAFDLSIAVAVKSTFAGRDVMRQGGTLFIAVEGQNEVRVRLEAAAAEKARPALCEPDDDRVDVDHDRLPFVWLESCPTLTAPGAAAKLSAIISTVEAEMQARFGLPLAIVIIDTISPAAGFKNADDTGENLQLMKVLTDTAVKFKILILNVDHFGKDTSTGTRNSSVKEANADAVLALLGDRDTAGKVSKQRLAIRKVRGAPTGEETLFERRVVMVKDRDGPPASTCVIDWGERDPSKRTEAGKLQRKTPKSLATFKKALEFTLADSGSPARPFGAEGPEVMAADRESVRNEFVKIYPADNADTKSKAFNRCEKDAVIDMIGSREIDGKTLFWFL